MKKLKTILIDTFFILVVILIFNMLVDKQLAKSNLNYKEYTVKSGDTIWSIATKISNEYKNLYIKNIINDIKKLNSLEDVVIYEGEQILIPTYQK